MFEEVYLPGTLPQVFFKRLVPSLLWGGNPKGQPKSHFEGSCILRCSVSKSTPQPFAISPLRTCVTAAPCGRHFCLPRWFCWMALFEGLASRKPKESQFPKLKCVVCVCVSVCVCVFVCVLRLRDCGLCGWVVICALFVRFFVFVWLCVFVL